MTNLTVIENKLSFIRKYLTILKDYRSKSFETISKDVILRGALERHLYLVVQASIDCAEAVIAYKNLRKPTSYKEAFEILLEDKIIPAGLCEDLAKMVGFRNIITHGYADVDYRLLYKILMEDISDIEKFVNIVAKKFGL